jgi:hypothetical protein
MPSFYFPLQLAEMLIMLHMPQLPTFLHTMGQLLILSIILRISYDLRPRILRHGQLVRRHVSLFLCAVKQRSLSGAKAHRGSESEFGAFALCQLIASLRSLTLGL